jgi:7-cyano-7-deazaguanine synthase in queuosine biosynthesis
MRRHSVIARLGPADTASVNLRETGTVVTQIRFIDGERRLGFGLGQAIEQLGKRGVVPSEQAVDLALLAATVTAADTRISRATESQDTWTREIDLYVPAQDPAMWMAAAPLIEKALNFLTGDIWRLYFRERHRSHRELVVRRGVLVKPSFTSVCLFSGGLDSFTGAIDLLAAGQNPIFVSHYWDISTSSQALCAKRIGTAYGALEPRHVRARVGFPNDLVKASAPEMTQRGRSFLFLALAALAASGLDGEPTIYVPENGLISLNVPLDPLRVGAWSTRTTHPFYMARWQELLRQLAVAATMTNPYRFKTKGEMLVGCANQNLLSRYAGETISCSSVTKGRWRKLSPGHCGYCVPCLIRRAALAKAFGTDSTKYTIPDLAERALDSGSAEGEHIRSFQMMARRLQAKPALASILVHKPGPLSDFPEGDIEQYAEVFSRGIAEVGTVISKTVVRPS